MFGLLFGPLENIHELNKLSKNIIGFDEEIQRNNKLIKNGGKHNEEE